MRAPFAHLLRTFPANLCCNICTRSLSHTLLVGPNMIPEGTSLACAPSKHDYLHAWLMLSRTPSACMKWTGKDIDALPRKDPKIKKKTKDM